MPKTEMSRFPIHDDLTAPRGIAADPQGCVVSSRAASELPRRAGGRAGRAEGLHALSARSSARRICRGTAPSGSASRWPSTTAPSRVCNCTPAPAGRSASGIDEVARAKRWDSGDAAEAALLRYLRPLLGDRANVPAAPPRGGARGGLDAKSSFWKPSRCCPWNPSPRWSTSPATSPWTGPSRRRGCCAPRDPHEAMGVDQPNADTTLAGVQPVLPALPRGGGAGRQALDRRDPLRPAARRSDALHRDRQRGAGSVATACCPSA